MREISVLGVSIADRSLRESLRLLGVYMEEEGLRTVCFLTTDLLMKAKDDKSLKEALEGMDLPVTGSVQILEAGGIKSATRKREVEGNYFLRELIKRLAREKKKIFLIADTQDALVSLREQLLLMEGKLTFFGSYSFDGPEVSDDAVINEINTVIPEVVISASASPRQELIMHGAKDMINARLWISLQDETVKALGSYNKKGFLSEIIDKLIFKRTVKKYDEG